MALGKQAKILLSRLSNVFTTEEDSVLGQLMGAIGSAFDLQDPSQTFLSDQFTISGASGAYLDLHGRDWGVSRKFLESDAAYRVRIQAIVPVDTTGPTLTNIIQIVQNFTGTAPVITEWGRESFTMGSSIMGSFSFTANDSTVFNFQVAVQNPMAVDYVRLDMENTINQIKPARSLATFIHSGGV